ncbi:hypothetical protein AZI86_09150 [Bdellovibrio bacteriovorus]|uniref:Peptidase M12A domain-containing protein n=1 Tax=Bdellovibrio bacteriovorus TaxID=959 RepID=A0A150WS06_BDEBC|nr:M12 family metallopeptidase [Bdellovibrio bacteriovorus]KYG67166.1 hypothetical protein AZI86_09150 [Bdellovibrio bacteriovorus]
MAKSFGRWMLPAVIAILILTFFFWKKESAISSAPLAEDSNVETKHTTTPSPSTPPTPPKINAELEPPALSATGSFEHSEIEPKNKKSSEIPLHYQVSPEGLAVVDGDIVLGEAGPGQIGAGISRASQLQLWPGGRIPFFIQGDLKNPERVITALGLFVDSGLQFTPYRDEEDILVFQTAESGCKSYLGKVGGKQPIWIGPNCGVTEIAHEIMHAVGFIHEQNRSDRDKYVRVLWDNIMDSAKGNFELFPAELMTASGTAPFDFESIMIYQPSAFSRNNQTTLEPLLNGAVISPSRNLSPSDQARIRRAYQLP